MMREAAGTGAPATAAVQRVARALAVASGHRDPEAPYLTADGQRVAIWEAYIVRAEVAIVALGEPEGDAPELADTCRLARGCPGRRALVTSGPYRRPLAI